MSGMHFERMAADYDGARPPYPPGVYRALADEGVIGPGARVLEIGAGSGLATRELVLAGCEVVAVEPGRRLADLLRQQVPAVPVLTAPLESLDLPDGSFDSAVAATAMHWVDLAVGLPKLHAALRPGGRLAVWRHRFGDDAVDTEFRRRVAQVVAGRARRRPERPRTDDRPTLAELTVGGLFRPVRTERWRWQIDLDAQQVHRLFSTFSDWTQPEVEAVARAVDDLGGVVTEHYQSVLHLLRRTASSQDG